LAGCRFRWASPAPSGKSPGCRRCPCPASSAGTAFPLTNFVRHLTHHGWRQWGRGLLFVETVRLQPIELRGLLGGQSLAVIEDEPVERLTDLFQPPHSPPMVSCE